MQKASTGYQPATWDPLRTSPRDPAFLERSSVQKRRPSLYARRQHERLYNLCKPKTMTRTKPIFPDILAVLAVVLTLAVSANTQKPGPQHSASSVDITNYPTEH